MHELSLRKVQPEVNEDNGAKNVAATLFNIEYIDDRKDGKCKKWCELKLQQRLRKCCKATTSPGVIDGLKR